MTASISFSQPALIPNICSTQQISPNAQLAKIPYRITGPAMVNILQPIPNTCPSFWYSTAGAVTELAKPVMGTKAPAPPHLAILG